MRIDEKVTVGIIDGSPRYVVWKGRNHTVTKIGLHHHFYEGKTLYHVFSIISGTIFMRLKLNTDNLSWKLEEISDAI